MNEHPDLLNGAYALDAVDDVERAAVERHLRTCEACAEEVAEFREAAARLGAEAVPPAGMRDRVLASARATRQLPAVVPGGSRRPRGRFLVAVAAAAAVLAGAVGVTWAVQQERVNDQRARVVALQEETARVLAAPDAKRAVSADVRTGRFTAVYSASQRAAVLTYDDLARTPDGKTYQLWRVDGGAATSLGVLKPGVRSGSLVVRNLGPGDALAVSLEDEGGAEGPTDIRATVGVA
ncbi:anti-sigma factor [Cryptosporangium phraense]|uniref:Regulator of SigK n=1 Tax=Cryptosporangium phraense TaxID=2593070 RepID=A0A545AW92_9ACTN|nr:anti-sigma factor [Cryptosporangium phraense]TQS45590.1 anti-sigma factor [Cryptosporangium phraense]